MYIASSLLVLFLGFAAPLSAQESRPPNLVVILADDLGYGDLSTYGGWIRTPNLDRLAAEGMRFTDFHASGPVCSPTRAGLLTGRYQQRAGLEGVIYAAPDRNRHHGLQTHEITCSQLLKKAGYATAVFGKWHLGYRKEYNPVHHGFDEFRGYVSGNVDFFSHVDGAGFYDWWDGEAQIEEAGYVTHLITKHAIRFIEEHQDRPFLLYLPHEAPHYPYQGLGDVPIREVGRQNKEDRNPTHVRRAYREMVQELDWGVGRVIDTLQRLGLAEKTFVLFFSDNGALEFGSNGELRGFKGSLWEGGHRVPAIAWWPGHIRAGSLTDATTISLDVKPTLLALAEVAAPEGHRLDGVNLLPLLLWQQSLSPRTLFWQYEGQAAVRKGAWKLVQNVRGQQGIGLYNLNEDPGEARNLLEIYPDRVQEMLAELERWRQDVSKGATVQPELNTMPRAQ